MPGRKTMLTLCSLAAVMLCAGLPGLATADDAGFREALQTAEVPTDTAGIYVGVKAVTAWPVDRDGQPGYAMRHYNGYTTWSPAVPFQKFYFQLGPATGEDAGLVTEDTVDRFTASTVTQGLGDRGTVTVVTTVTGLDVAEKAMVAETYAFDSERSASISEARAAAHVWELLGFVRQWAANGVRPDIAAQTPDELPDPATAAPATAGAAVPDQGTETVTPVEEAAVEVDPPAPAVEVVPAPVDTPAVTEV